MAKNSRTELNSYRSQWWRPNKTEYVMLTVAALTLVISILTQINALLENTIKIGEIYTQLYPVLNAFHLFVILYAMYQMQNIKKLLPDTLIKTTDSKYKKKAEKLVDNLKDWIKEYIGNFYYSDEYSDGNIKDEYVKELIKNTNRNINILYKYWSLVWIWLFALYVFEFIKSISNSNYDVVLSSLVITFNNLLSIYWFFIYLKLNKPRETERLTQDDKKEIEWVNYVIHKFIYKVKRFIHFSKSYEVVDKYDKYKNCNEYGKYMKKWLKYNINKLIYSVTRFTHFSKPFGKVNKYDEYEKYNETKKEKYKEIEIPRNRWKITAWSIFIVSIVFLLFYNLSKIDNGWCKYFKIINIKDDWYEVSVYISVLLGACSMLAAFSRLGSGFFRIPLSALLIMLFYSAVQPLFFADKDLLNEELKSGQLLFIINFICLIGKFALLYIIRWIFSDYRIAYYFINEQIINNKKISDEDLKKLFEKIV